MCWNGISANADAGWLAIPSSLQRTLSNVSKISVVFISKKLKDKLGYTYHLNT